MKPFLASLLALLVFHQALTAQTAQATDFAEMAKALGIGTNVEVQLVGGSHIRGRISAAARRAGGLRWTAQCRESANHCVYGRCDSERQPATHTPILAGLRPVQSWRPLSLPFRFY